MATLCTDLFISPPGPHIFIYNTIKRGSLTWNIIKTKEDKREKKRKENKKEIKRIENDWMPDYWELCTVDSATVALINYRLYRVQSCYNL